jgi:PncC family amidohydrolase
VTLYEDLERASEVGRLLQERGWTIATAESCTGGLVGHLLTEVSGSSLYYLGGVVAYANSAKTGMLGVSVDDLSRYGAVSAPVARAMARSVRDLLGTHLGLSTTGQHVWGDTREVNKLASARRALDLVIELLRCT